MTVQRSCNFSLISKLREGEGSPKFFSDSQPLEDISPMSAPWYLQSSPTVSSPCRKDRCPQWRHKLADLSGKSCRPLLSEYTHPSIPRRCCLHASPFACDLPDSPQAPRLLSAYPVCSCPEGRLRISFLGTVLACHRQESTELYWAHRGPVCTTFSAKDCRGFD